MIMKLKTIDVEGKTYAEIQDDKPVYTDDNGKDTPFDVEHTVATISKLNSEAKNNRIAKEEAEKERSELQESLKAYGDLKPDEVKKAIETVKNLDDKKLVEAGEVEKVKSEAIKAIHAEYAPKIEAAEKLESELRNERIGGQFARSKFINEKLAIPQDMVQSRFGANFKLEDGQVVAYDGTGNQIYSKSKPGELAGFDEAIETLVDQYPYKDSIMKSSGATGGGASSSNGAAPGKKDIKREQFEALSQPERMKFSKDGGKVVE